MGYSSVHGSECHKKRFEPILGNMRTITINVPGNPQAQKRHRHTKRGSYIHTYDPCSNDKNVFLFKTLAEKKPDKLILGPIKMTLIFHMPRSKSHYRTGKFSGILKDSAPNTHSSKPDIDNLQKFVLDSLNGVYFKDDAQVYMIIASKWYSEEPCTLIEMEYDTIKNDFK